jgi:hypothetical protein
MYQANNVQAMDGRVEVSFPAPSHAASIAAESSQPDVGETVMPGEWFWLLLPKQK